MRNRLRVEVFSFITNYTLHLHELAEEKGEREEGGEKDKGKAREMNNW